MAVLVINTGGALGSVHQKPNDPLSPLVSSTWEQIAENVPDISQLGIEAEYVSFSPLLDSSNMSAKNWLQIARTVKDRYEDFEGFLILHGTETMTYTASALSFMFENLAKPVILTGSHLPIGNVRSDAVHNLVTAMQIAAPISTGLPIVPEVCICFGHLLIRGNRSRQYNSSGFTTFVSPNYAPLGKSGEQIEIDRCSIRTPKNGDFFISEKMETNVILLDVFPGMDSKILRKLFEMNPKGVVLKTLGGATKEFLDAVEEAVAKEIVVVDVTSNLSEMAKIGFYEKGGELVNRGVVSGVDMTPEAAVCKLMYLLGKGWPTAEVKRIMQLNQRGEQSRNIYEIVYEPGSADLVGTVGPKVIPDGFEKERLTNAIIRIQDVRTIGSERDIRIKAFLNLPNANKETPSSSPQCAGQIESRWEERPVNLSIDATKMTQALNPSLPISITIVAEEQGVTWKRVILSIYSRT